MNTIEERIKAIEDRLGIAPDPYAEAKQAFKDGCLQVFEWAYGKSCVDMWVDWKKGYEPNYLRPPQDYRRKPEEKKPGRKSHTFTIGPGSRASVRSRCELVKDVLACVCPGYVMESVWDMHYDGQYSARITITK